MLSFSFWDNCTFPLWFWYLFWWRWQLFEIKNVKQERKKRNRIKKKQYTYKVLNDRGVIYLCQKQKFQLSSLLMVCSFYCAVLKEFRQCYVTSVFSNLFVLYSVSHRCLQVCFVLGVTSVSTSLFCTRCHIGVYKFVLYSMSHRCLQVCFVLGVTSVSTSLFCTRCHWHHL